MKKSHGYKTVDCNVDEKISCMLDYASCLLLWRRHTVILSLALCQFILRMSKKDLHFIYMLY